MSGGPPSESARPPSETFSGASALLAAGPPPFRAIVFDIEIEKSPDDFADKWQAARRGDCGLSVACAYDSALQRSYVYDRHNLNQLVVSLNEADLIVSFNGKGFDLPVIEAVSGFHVNPRGHFDILAEIWRQLKHKEKGWKLDQVCQRTLGAGKDEMDGPGAIKLWSEGRFAEVTNYCTGDVMLTRRLYNHIVMQEHVVRPDGTLMAIQGWSKTI